MNLNSAAGLLGMFLKRGHESAGPEIYAGKIERGHGRGEVVRVDVRRSRELERLCRPPSLGHLRALQMHSRGEYNSRLWRRHVRRRQDPGTVGVVIPKFSRPARHGYAFQIATNPELLIKHPAQLTHCHSVTRGDRELAHERGEGWIEHDAVDLNPANGVRPIAGNHLLTQLFCRPHAIGQRVNKGVDARAHVLQIKNDDVDIAQHFFRRLAGFTIERIDRQSSLSIGGVPRLNHIVLYVAANPVLGTKERCEIDVRVFVEEIGDVVKAVIYRSLVAHKANPRTSQQLDLFSEQSFNAQIDRLDTPSHYLTTQHRPAIHVKDLAIDMTGPFATEKDYWPGDVFRRGYAANRDRVLDRLAKVRVLKNV
ncbi:MAG: hypothetical protein QOH41_572 [Blastocatellia bacterium]|nr:hypothetical protein [Blastocatellia bacterium]